MKNLALGVLFLTGCVTTPPTPVPTCPDVPPCRPALVSGDLTSQCRLPVSFSPFVDQSEPTVVVCVLNPAAPALECMTMPEAQRRAEKAAGE